MSMEITIDHKYHHGGKSDEGTNEIGQHNQHKTNNDVTSDQ